MFAAVLRFTHKENRRFGTMQINVCNAMLLAFGIAGAVGFSAASGEAGQTHPSRPRRTGCRSLRTPPQIMATCNRVRLVCRSSANSRSKLPTGTSSSAPRDVTEGLLAPSTPSRIGISFGRAGQHRRPARERLSACAFSLRCSQRSTSSSSPRRRAHCRDPRLCVSFLRPR